MRLSGLLLLPFLTVCAQENRLQIRVDPRLELLTIVQVLADYGWTGLLNREDTPYRRDVREWFGPHKGHPAVTRFAELAKTGGYTHDGPVGTMVCLSDPPELKLLFPAGNCSADRAGGAQSLEAWLHQLRDFASASDFTAFFRAHRGFYSLTEETVRKKIEADYAAQLEDYYRTRQASYQIVLTPLQVGNYGPRLPRSDGTFDLYGVLGSFGSVDTIRYMIWHEFGHSFVNPEVNRLSDRVAKSSKLFGPIERKMRQQAYSEWLNAVREHVVRAVTVRLAYLQLGEDAGQVQLAQERARGFAYVGALAERLKEYEIQRDHYATFHSFIPRLLGVLDELAAKELPADFYLAPYAGNIDSVSAGGRPVLVMPTAESDPAAQAKIQTDVKAIRDRFFKVSEIVTDDEALKRDLSSSPVIAYGTLSGNKWLARYKDRIPALPEFQRMLGDEPLRLIATLPHPQNSNLGALAYTATEAAAVPGINGLFHGGTAYVIGRGNNVLKTGDYRRQKGQWVLK